MPANFPGTSPTGPLYPGTPRFELWPFWLGNTEKVYRALYQRRGDALLDDRGSVDSVVPYPLEPELVLLKAKIEASIWADRNKGSYSQWAKVAWMDQIKVLSGMYQESYLRNRRVDNDLIDNSFGDFESGDGEKGYSALIGRDPQYSQTHATGWETWGSL